jgi:hypothetical protein
MEEKERPMRVLKAAIFGFGVLCMTMANAQAPDQDRAAPVVVELYTSQGCALCPPADEVLRQLSQRDDVIALALHVDYWDYIGWVDIFGRPENTARQQLYAQVAGAATIYTPQIVIGGVDHVIGSRAMQVMDLVQAHKEQPRSIGVDLVRADDRVTIVANAGPRGLYDVQLVRYMPQAQVDIRGGENAGQVMHYTNIVTSWDLLGQWDGNSDLRVSAAAPGPDPVVVIIQQAGQGPIMAAAQLR